MCPEPSAAGRIAEPMRITQSAAEARDKPEDDNELSTQLSESSLLNLFGSGDLPVGAMLVVVVAVPVEVVNNAIKRGQYLVLRLIFDCFYCRFLEYGRSSSSIVVGQGNKPLGRKGPCW